MDGDTSESSEARVHTNIGRDGVIVECRPQGQDFPNERDMAYLSEEEAEHLRDQLNEYLESRDCG